MLAVSIEIFKKYKSLMRYEPKRPDEIYRIRLDYGFGVSDDKQEELRINLDKIWELKND
jgi:hypothetical protein